MEAVEERTLLSAPHHVAGNALAAATAYAIAHSPPVIIQAVEVVDAGRVVAFQITFSKPVNVARLNDLSRYQIGPASPTSPPITISSATYDPAQNSLTLALATPLPPGYYTVSSADVNDQSNDFITDAQGRPLKTPYLDGEFLVSFRKNGSDLTNAVRTPYPALNRLDGWTREMTPAPSGINNGLDNSVTIVNASYSGVLALLHFLL
jgi:hypothetical protein